MRKKAKDVDLGDSVLGYGIVRGIKENNPLIPSLRAMWEKTYTFYFDSHSDQNPWSATFGANTVLDVVQGSNP